MCCEEERRLLQLHKGNVTSSVGDVQKVRVMLLDEKNNLEKDFSVSLSYQE
jgi:hypothetical protein